MNTETVAATEEKEFLIEVGVKALIPVTVSAAGLETAGNSGGEEIERAARALVSQNYLFGSVHTVFSIKKITALADEGEHQVEVGIKAVIPVEVFAASEKDAWNKAIDKVRQNYVLGSRYTTYSRVAKQTPPPATTVAPKLTYPSIRRLLTFTDRDDKLECIARTETAIIYRIKERAGLILKIFDLTDEFNVASILRRANHRLSRIAEVYRLRQVKYRHGDYDAEDTFSYAMINEELGCVSEQIKADYRILDGISCGDLLFNLGDNLAPSRVEEFVLEVRRRGHESAADLALDLSTIFTEAESIGISITDFHLGNLGMKNGKVAMFDVR